MSPTHTPQRSPFKVSNSQSQEDIKSYELVDNLQLDEDDQDDEDSMSVEKSSPQSQIKQPRPQTSAEDDQDMEVEEDIPSPTPAPLADSRRQQARTPEPSQRRSQKASGQLWPGSPGALAPFDWEDFESRYEKALTEADQKEAELVAEFEHLVQYFNVWASASSSHDSERAVKRLQTRTRYVHLSENRLKQKKEHLAEVVKAFKGALHLLSTERS
ncbi:hypothetical protein PFICI_07173 [Pestalotiopsis fici W106-1]|uniref:Uncharacterized protein n=1 Tax=Pestalotiopsis fici (strain W106-1 / CGMCC3.15140) TaxID=1229662 RepID=W3XAI1_PESFW|nr:uncharacterized protein PFICI_07173 [Pestalotiopsis fici W106-1]ETS82171.1 hypothetical protein PFICI_07173 [Pestalotiopsis fici W106-1]